MQHFRPTLAFKLPIPLAPTLYLLSLLSHHRFLVLAVSLHLLLLPPGFFRVVQWNAGGLPARSTKLPHFILSHPIDLICIQKSNLNLSFSFRIPRFSALRSHRTHSQSGILLITRMLSAASSFSSGKAYPSVNFLPPLFLHLTPTVIMWGSTSLYTTPPHSHSLMFTLPLFALFRRMAEPTPFFPLSLQKISSFWGTSIAITLSGTQEVLPTSAERKYSTGSSPPPQ